MLYVDNFSRLIRDIFVNKKNWLMALHDNISVNNKIVTDCQEHREL